MMARKGRPCREICLGLVLLIASAGSHAAAGAWTSVGPEAGLVRAFGFVPGTDEVYGVVRGGGVFKSTDGGVSWSAASDGITTWRLTAVAALDSSRAVVGSEDGLFVTTDGGATWLAAGLAGRRINTLVVHPSDARTVVAGTDAGIYRSTNGGASWSSDGSGLAGDVRAIVFQPGDAATVYAGLYDGGTYLFKSTDGGAHWSGAGMGLMGPVLALYVDPLAPSTVYAATQMFLQKSTDGGAGMGMPVGGPPMLGISGIARAPGTGDLIASAFGGVVYASPDGGASWNMVAEIPIQEPQVIAADPDGGALFVSGQRGPYRTVDGKEWSLGTDGLRAANVRVVITDPDSDVFYAATDHAGLMRTSDGGITWTRVDNGTLSGALALARDPTDGNVFYAGLQGAENAGLISGDGGATWTPFGFAYTNVDWLRFSGGSLFAGLSGGVYDFQFSQDGAGSWSRLYDGVQFLDAIAFDDGSLLAATEHGLLRRTATESWSRADSGLTGIPSRLVHGAAGDVYAATATAVYRSSDAGLHWVEDGAGFANGGVLGADDGNGMVYLGADGVWRRQNGSWSALSAGELGNRKVQALALRVPVDYDVTLYAATEGGGLFRYRVDTTPDALTFVPQSEAPKSAAVESEGLAVQGVEIPIRVRVVGGEYRINGGAYTTGSGWINEGDLLQLRTTSAATALTGTTMVAQVGPSVFSFSVTTVADPPPDSPPAGEGADSPQGEGGGGALSPLLLLAGAVMVRRMRRARPVSCGARCRGAAE